MRASILGRTVGKLTVIGELPTNSGKLRKWICRCDCGNEVARYSSQLSLVQKYIVGCDACHAESTRKRSTVHGHARRENRGPEYSIWKAMRNRCAAKEGHPDYPYWAARGITICERWNDYAAFLADMGPRPSADHSIDRYPDNDGNYEPGNCKWATPVEQSRNRRSVKLTKADADNIRSARAHTSGAQLAREYGVCQTTISNIVLGKNWT